jgi:outer membrane biosynthesis protein TonB
MTTAVPLEDVHPVTANGLTSFFVQQAGSAAEEALLNGLRAAGFRVVTVRTVWDVVVEIERAGGARFLVAGIDSFGRDEFRLFPLVRREWPETVIVAYLNPGFEHLGHIAELVGADVVLASLRDISAFINSLAPGPPQEAPKPEPAAPPPAPAAPDKAPEPVAAKPFPAPAHASPVAPPLAPAAPDKAPEPAAAKPSPVPAHASPVAPPPSRPSEPPAAPEADEAVPYGSPILEALAQTAAKTPPPAPKAAEPPARRTSALDALAAAVAELSPAARKSNLRAPSVQGQPANTPPATEEVVDGGNAGTVEITDEELRILLGEDEGAEPGAKP